MIKTSVIIPVYNTAEYLEECIESVLAQNREELEIILVDDGSDDGSWEIEKDYAERYPFIRAVRQDHLYQGTARNRGLQMAQGEFIYFMDSDDAILPGLFDACYQECEKRDLDFVMFDARGFRYDENDRELEVPEDIVDRRKMGIEDRIYSGPEFWNSFYNRHGILYVCWLLYIRKSYLLEHSLTYEERTYFEDNDWMLRMYLHASRTAYIPEIYHRHRWRRGSNMLDGFTVGLMEGCFRMHDVLLDLYGQYFEKGDTDRVRMIEDVISLNVRRFDRIREITPSEEYLKPLARFCGHVREELAKPDSRGDVYYINLAVACKVSRAAKKLMSGKAEEAVREVSEYADRADFLGMPANMEETGVGIYGTGKIAGLLVELLEAYGKPFPASAFFIETDSDGGTFCGRPVCNVQRLPQLRPAVIVLASTKYRDEIYREALKYSPEGTKIVTVPHGWKFFL